MHRTSSSGAGGRTRGRRPRMTEGQPESAGMMRWLLTYADMITLLLIFFVILYALSRVNQHKYEALVQAMRAALSGKSVSAIHKPPAHAAPYPATTRSPVASPALFERFRRLVAKDHLQAFVAVYRVPLGVEVVFLNGILFPSARAELTPAAILPLEAVDGALRAIPNQIVVQGYANSLPIHTPAYHSNWDLSSMRASRVADFWMARGVAATRMLVEGFGQWYPVASNSTPTGLRANRSVSVLILNRDVNLRDVVLGTPNGR